MVEGDAERREMILPLLLVEQFAFMTPLQPHATVARNSWMLLLPVIGAPLMPRANGRHGHNGNNGNNGNNNLVLLLPCFPLFGHSHKRATHRRSVLSPCGFFIEVFFQ